MSQDNEAMSRDMPPLNHIFASKYWKNPIKKEVILNYSAKKSKCMQTCIYFPSFEVVNLVHALITQGNVN